MMTRLIFLLEADYALKYVGADVDVTVPLSELGITEDDLSDQYQYTKGYCFRRER